MLKLVTSNKNIRKNKRRKNNKFNAKNQVNLEIVNRIYAASASHFANHGYGVANINKIAESANCAFNSIYYYFNGKENLYIETINQLEKEASYLIKIKLNELAMTERKEVSCIFITTHQILTSKYEFTLLFRAKHEIQNFGESGHLLKQITVRFRIFLEGLFASCLTKKDNEAHQVITAYVNQLEGATLNAD